MHAHEASGSWGILSRRHVLSPEGSIHSEQFGAWWGMGAPAGTPHFGLGTNSSSSAGSAFGQVATFLFIVIVVVAVPQSPCYQRTTVTMTQTDCRYKLFSSHTLQDRPSASTSPEVVTPSVDRLQMQDQLRLVAFRCQSENPRRSHPKIIPRVQVARSVALLTISFSWPPTAGDTTPVLEA